MSRDEVTIREAALADVPRICDLVQQYWQFEAIDGFDRQRIAVLLGKILDHRHLGVAWVAQSGGAVIGYLVAVFVMSLEHKGLMAEIDEFFVVPAARAKGAGKQLLLAAERGLTQAGCVRLQLQLGVENVAARGFYKRHGYEPRDGYGLMDKALG